MPGIITFSKLGRLGQAGNCIMEYAFLRTYARRFGLDYQCPDWGNKYLFGHNDPPVTTNLPTWLERREPCPHGDLYGVPIPDMGDLCVGHDYYGWAQFHTSWYAPDKEFIQSLFHVVSPERDRVLPALYNTMGDTVISLHLRRGDSGRLIFPLLPITWPLRWLHANWSRFKNPVLYIATENKTLAKHFHYYHPVMQEDLGIMPTGVPPPNYKYPHTKDNPSLQTVDWFPDWYILQHSDVILASDSAFSSSAAMMNHNIKEFWRPRLSLQGFEKVDPWNMPFITREHLDDWPGIPGTQIDSNLAFAHCWRGFRPKFPSVPETEEMIKECEVPPCA